jgi:hypothetical protein
MKIIVSTRRVQTCWRRHQAFRLYRLQLSASVRLQASWRRRVGFDNHLQKKAAVILLQSAIRRHQQMVFRWAVGRSASGIQYWWRRRLHDMVVQQATLRIQTFCRTSAARTRYQQYRVSAVLVQRVVRQRVARRKWTKLRASCLLVQTVIRRRMIASRYHVLLNATGLLQRLWRGFQCRLQLTRWSVAAAKIQSVLRLRLARGRARMLQDQVAAFLKSNASTIQACMRRYARSKQFNRKQAAAMVIKRAYVSWKMKLRLVKLQCAAVLLHRRVRGQLSRCELFALTQANSCLRSKIVTSFGLIVPNQSELHHAWKHAVFEVQRNAAMLIKRSYRSQRRERTLRHHRSAVIIQLAIKKFVLGKRLQRRRASQLRRSPVSMTVVRQISPVRLEVEFSPVEEGQTAQSLQPFWQQHQLPMHQTGFTSSPQSLERPSIGLEVVRQISRQRLEVKFFQSQSPFLEQMLVVETFRKKGACKKLQSGAQETLKVKRQQRAARVVQAAVLAMLERRAQDRARAVHSLRRKLVLRVLASFVIFALEKCRHRRRVIDSFRRKTAAQMLVKFFLLALPKCRLRREQATCQFKQRVEIQAETLVAKLLCETQGLQCQHALKRLESSQETGLMTTTTMLTTTTTAGGMTTTVSGSLLRYLLRTQQARLESVTAAASLEHRRKDLADYKRKKNKRLQRLSLAKT